MQLQPGRPRHEQLSDWLREQIGRGLYQPDDRLPSESQLGETFEVSRITVRRALQTLESEGLIYRRQGLGSFVSDKRVRQGLVQLTDFVEDMALAGLEAASRVMHYGVEEAAPDIAEKLGVAMGARIFRLDRLRLGDGEPFAFDRTWLPVFFAHLLEGHDLEEETIYRILERDYDIPIIRGRYRLEAVNAGNELSRILDVPEHAALLLIERLSMSREDKRVYYQRRYYRSDRVAYELELERDPARGQEGGMPLQEFEPVFKTGEGAGE